MRLYEDQFYCYLRGATLRVLLDDGACLDTLMAALGVTGKPAQNRKMPPKEKWQAIEHQIAHLQKTPTGPWYQIDASEIVAATLFRVLGSKAAKLFGAARSEEALRQPIVSWLKREKKLNVYDEVSTARNRADVMGYGKDGLFFKSDFVVAVELKNDLRELKRAADQLLTYSEYAHEVYLACTPYMAAECLHEHASAPTVRNWDPEWLNNRLRKIGAGLLLVNMGNGRQEPEIITALKPMQQSPNPKKLAEVLRSIGTP